jgi:hypothetical protein
MKEVYRTVIAATAKLSRHALKFRMTNIRHGSSESA